MADKENNSIEDQKNNLIESLKTLFTETENMLDQTLPFDDEIDFKISDIIDPIHLNLIKMILNIITKKLRYIS